MQAMKRRIRENFWRRERYLRDCINCAISDKSQVTIPCPVKAIEIPN